MGTFSGLDAQKGLDIGSQGLTFADVEDALDEGGSFHETIKRLIEANDETGFKLERILNNGIDFGDNVRGGFIEVVTTGDTQEVQHGLGFEPVGFFLLWKDGPGDVYADRVTEWNKERLFLNASVANLTIRLFVL